MFSFWFFFRLNLIQSCSLPETMGKQAKNDFERKAHIIKEKMSKQKFKSNECGRMQANKFHLVAT